MSESSAKSGQPLAAKQDKDVSEKRGRGRPRKQPQQEPSEASVPKRPRGRPKGSKNKTASKGRRNSSPDIPVLRDQEGFLVAALFPWNFFHIEPSADTFWALDEIVILFCF
uniref:Uncharacterized protein n=1 Tax=Sphaerodactylus townsendi TaxID=933632 RepID=A0ACB8F4U7_9SAUR